MQFYYTKVGIINFVLLLLSTCNIVSPVIFWVWSKSCVHKFRRSRCCQLYRSLLVLHHLRLLYIQAPATLVFFSCSHACLFMEVIKCNRAFTATCYELCSQLFPPPCAL
ncbi:unnamed protein product [Ixodes persulcatus]